MSDSFICAMRELQRRKGRTVLNVIGYLLAVAILVILTSLLLFSRNGASKVLSGTGTHFIGFNPLCATGACFYNAIDPKNEGFVANGVKTKLLDADLLKLLHKFPSIKNASPFLLFKFLDSRDGSTFTVGGFKTNNDEAIGNTCCAASDLISGRFLTSKDKNVAMIESAYADAQHLHVGETVTITGEKFPIIGIVNPGVRPAKADIYLRFEDAQRVINRRVVQPLRKSDMNIVLVEVASSTLQKQAITDLQSVIAISQISSYACWKPAARVMGMTEHSMWLLAILLTLGTVAFAVKTQWGSVVERQHDIGILKAIGWTDRVVVRQIVTESLVQALIGGVLGCIIGVIFLLLLPVKQLTGIDNTTMILSPIVLLGAIALALLSGMVAGIIPAWHAARQRPADALRQL